MAIWGRSGSSKKFSMPSGTQSLPRISNVAEIACANLLALKCPSLEGWTRPGHMSDVEDIYAYMLDSQAWCCNRSLVRTMHSGHLRKPLEGDPVTMMNIDLDAEDSLSREHSTPATPHDRDQKGKTPVTVQRPGDGHHHNFDPFMMCSDGD